MHTILLQLQRTHTGQRHKLYTAPKIANILFFLSTLGLFNKTRNPSRTIFKNARAVPLKLIRPTVGHKIINKFVLCFFKLTGSHMALETWHGPLQSKPYRPF